MDLLKKIRIVPDFPKKGIQFFDITTLLQDPEGYRNAIDVMADKIKEIPCDVIIGLESRGFLFASPIAYKLGKSYALVRKKGKLPYRTASVSFDLEYGTDTFEIHQDAVKPGQNVVIVDDLLATGGSTQATVRLVEKLGGKVTAVLCLIELEELEGRKRITADNVISIIKAKEHND